MAALAWLACAGALAPAAEELGALRAVFGAFGLPGGGDPCAWRGVTCDGAVTELDLRGRALRGPIPAELGELSKLGHVRLDSNELSGSTPGRFREHQTPENAVKLNEGFGLRVSAVSAGSPDSKETGFREQVFRRRLASSRTCGG